MVRIRQPLPRYSGCRLSHKEFVEVENSKGSVIEQRTIDDCKKLQPVADYDLETRVRSGENLKEVSTTLYNSGKINFKQSEVQPEEQSEEKGE